MTDRLYRSRDDRMLAGVAGGLSETVGIDSSIIRVVWAVLVFLTGGLALLVYVVMAIVVPERPIGVDARRPGDAGVSGSVPPGGGPVPTAGAGGPPRSDAARGGLVAGLILILVGGFFLIRELIPAIDLGFWWPTVAIGLGVLLIVLAVAPSRRSG